MRVLITNEQSNVNLYIHYLYLGIKDNAEVVNSVHAFWTSNMHFDIIHLHWPEFLLDANVTRNDIYQSIKGRIIYWKKQGARIVITRHNYCPHNAQNHPPEIFDAIYDMVYKLSDAIVHHGEYSYNQFVNHPEYSKILNIKINHPNYLIGIENSISKEEARRILNIPLDRILYIAFGDIRTKDEENSLIEAFNSLKVKNKHLLMMRSPFNKNSPNKKDFLKSMTYTIKRKQYEAKNITFNYNGIIPNNQVQIYMNAADVVVSSRLHNLNSGVIYMAMSFGKIIVGPATGNITEILEATDNPSFSPNDNLSLRDALKKGTKIIDENIGANNYAYVKDNCDVYKLGQQYINLYKELIDV